MQPGVAVRVAEPHPVELEQRHRVAGAGDPEHRGSSTGHRALGHVVVLGLEREHLLHPGQRAQPGLQLRVGPDGLAQRHDQQEQVQDERDQVSDRDRAGGDPVAAQPQDGEERALHGDRPGRGDQRLEPGHRDTGGRRRVRR